MSFHFNISRSNLNQSDINTDTQLYQVLKDALFGDFSAFQLSVHELSLLRIIPPTSQSPISMVIQLAAASPHQNDTTTIRERSAILIQILFHNRGSVSQPHDLQMAWDSLNEPAFCVLVSICHVRVPLSITFAMIHNNRLDLLQYIRAHHCMPPLEESDAATGRTILHEMVLCSHPFDMLQFLVNVCSGGALDERYLTILDSQGFTPLDLAARVNPEIYAYLQAHKKTVSQDGFVAGRKRTRQSSLSEDDDPYHNKAYKR